VTERATEDTDGHAPTRRDCLTYGGAVVGGGLLAGCAGDGSESTASPDAADRGTSTDGATTEGAPGPATGDGSYSVTLAPVGDVTFDAVPETAYAYSPQYAHGRGVRPRGRRRLARSPGGVRDVDELLLRRRRGGIDGERRPQGGVGRRGRQGAVLRPRCGRPPPGPVLADELRGGLGSRERRGGPGAGRPLVREPLQPRAVAAAGGLSRGLPLLHPVGAVRAGRRRLPRGAAVRGVPGGVRAAVRHDPDEPPSRTGATDGRTRRVGTARSGPTS